MPESLRPISAPLFRRPSQTQRMLPHVAHERQPQAALHTSGLRSSSTRGAATPRALAPSSARPRLAPCRSAVMDAPAPAAAGAPALADIPLASVINTSVSCQLPAAAAPLRRHRGPAPRTITPLPPSPSPPPHLFPPYHLPPPPVITPSLTTAAPPISALHRA